MEMHEIRYFLAACQTLNFHRAAEHVHVGQPALTRAIQKLETELGGNLFHREKGHVQLTDFGGLMRTRLEEVLRSSETAKRAAKNFLSLEAATLTLGVMCTIGPLRFIGFMRAFRARHPGIEITMIEGRADRLVALLIEGDLDIAILARPEPFDDGLKAEPLFRERFGLAFSAGHAFERCNTIQLDDIRGETRLERSNCEYADYIGALFMNLGVETQSVFRSEREDWILAMVAAGMGVCFMAEFSAGQTGVCHRPIADPEIIREVSIVSVADRPPSPATAAFMKVAREYVWM